MNVYDYQNLIENNPINIATVNKDNKPNLAIASNVRVIEENKLVISVNEMKNTPNNIIRNPNIVITVFNKEWKGLRLFGEAKFYTSGEYCDFCYETFYKGRISPIGLTRPKGAIVVEINKLEELK